MRIALLMTDECIVGREMYQQVCAAGHDIQLVVIERSPRAEKEKTYLASGE